MAMRICFLYPLTLALSPKMGERGIFQIAAKAALCNLAGAVACPMN